MLMVLRSYKWLIQGVGCVFLLAACGGGGGSGSGPGALTPAISAQPSNQSATDGSSVTFAVVAGGAPLTYQWFRDGVPIAGATSSTYTLVAALADDGSSFYVTVSTGSTTVTSRSAMLSVDPAAVHAGEPLPVIVDDYRPNDPPWGQWYYSRIGTDRGTMAVGAAPPALGGGSARTLVISPGQWSGVWTSLVHSSKERNTLDPQNLLGPFVKSRYQFRVTAVEIEAAGTGTLKVELKDASEGIVAFETFSLAGRTTHHMTVNTQQPLMLLNWLLDGPGQVEVYAVRLLVISDQPVSSAEAMFLWSLGHLSQAYDPVSHLVRDRANWPAGDFDASQATGMFALALAVAADLGYVDPAVAAPVISDIGTTIRTLTETRSHGGLLPHFLRHGSIAPNTEWSSVDTTLAILSASIACRATQGCNPSPLDHLLTLVAWDELTNSGSTSVAHGYSFGGALIPSRWDTWGGEAFLVTAAYAGVSQRALPLTFLDPAHPKTWDGSGFNDELAALFFKMTGPDAWGLDWAAYRAQARTRQLEYFQNASHDAAYETRGLFGLSACEVPEPWASPNEQQVYQVLGVGGFNGAASNDGASTLGYPFVCPHYAALIAAEESAAFERLADFLIHDARVFTPLNNVESVGIDPTGRVAWNELKGSWNLSLQALGAARAIYRFRGVEYLPYRTVSPLWQSALQVMLRP